jgi:hypothetical protein
MEAAAQSMGGTHTGSSRWLAYFLPSLTDFAFLWPAVMLFVMLPGSSMLLSDGDTGWHIRTGEWIWQHKAVPTSDLFSFTKPHEPWFAWEWGCELLFAGVHHLAGLGGIVFLSTVLLCAVSALLFRLIRRYSGNDLLALVMTAFAMFGTLIHCLARPHLVSWLFILIFAHLLLSAEKGKTGVLFCLPALTLLWVNLHGAFFVGIVMLLTSAAGEALDVLFSDKPLKAAWNNAKPYSVCALACSAVTFLNPYTWHLHWHVFHYIRDSRLLGMNNEFQSISFHSFSSRAYECMLLLGVGTAFWCVRQRQFGSVISILLWAHWSLLAGRNIPVFLLIATPIFSQAAQSGIEKLKGVRRFAHVGLAISNFGREFQPFEQLPRLYLVSLAGLLWVAAGLALEKPGFEAQFNPKNFPVQALPFIRNAKFSRLFTTDQWGDYLIYHLYPARRVYMDGRSDFFGADFAERYSHIVNARHDWETQLRADGVDAVVLRPDVPVVSALKESKNWKLLFDNGFVVIFQLASTQASETGAVKSLQVSPVACGGRKKLGSLTPGALLNLNTQSQERRSS